MSIWVLILLCVIQGLTEFLPVSSSGHLMLVEQLFGISDNLMLLNLFLHIATLLAVIIIYRKVIFNLIKKPFQPYTFKLLVATLFSVAIAFVYKYSGINDVVCKIYPFGFLLTSLLLLLSHIFQRRAESIKCDEITMKNAVLVGIVQGFAVVPGLSRSGSTISSLILTGNDEQNSAEFSFLLSIPIIVGGFTLELIDFVKNGVILANFNISMFVFAFFLTFVVSLVALIFTIKLLKKQKFIIFSIYTFLIFILTFYLNYLL